ncbi:MAG: metal ABC transporter substrate-binding protein [Bacillota bacterium]
MKRAILILALLFSITLPGCARGVSDEATRPLVVTSIYPLADVVRQLAGEDVEVICLMPPGASPHTFEPTPGQISRAHRADLIVAVGAGLDNWLVEPLVQGGPLVVITEGVPLKPAREPHDHEDSHDPEGNGDPHIWLDPVMVRDVIAPRISSALETVYPGDSARMDERLKAFHQSMDALDLEVGRVLEPFRGARFVSFHPAWDYFAARYGLEDVGPIAQFPGQEPSARYLADLASTCSAKGVRVVVAEPQLNPQAAKVIAEEINGSVVILDPLGGPSVEGRDTYQEIVRYNANVLAGALGKGEAE